MERLILALAIFAGAGPLSVDFSRASAQQRDEERERDYVYITSSQQRLGRWFTGQFLDKRVRVVLHNVNNAEACLRKTVTFTPLTNALVSGGDAKGEWDGKTCRAAIRWRLSDNPGPQELQARLGRNEAAIVPDSAAMRTTVEFTATAHAPASLFIGGAYVFRRIEGVSGGDTTSFAARRRTFQPIIGLEAPLLVALSRKSSFLDSFRLVAATSLKDIASDLYLGLQVYPIFMGARGSGFPLQASLGTRIGFRSKASLVFVALTYNASGALTTALGKL
jgi:hypothetical protein